MTPITRLRATIPRLRATNARARAARPAASPSSAKTMGRVGVALPARSSARRVTDGDVMGMTFRGAGREIDLRHAAGVIPNPLARIEAVIATGGDGRGIAALDGTTRTAARAGTDSFAGSRIGDPRSAKPTETTLRSVRSAHDGLSRLRGPNFPDRPLRHAEPRRVISSP